MFRPQRTAVCLTLVVVMAMSPSLAYAQAPAASAADVTKTARKLGVSCVVPEAFFGAVIFPKRILTSPLMQMNPMMGALVAQMRKDLGLDPTDIEELLIVVDNPQPGEQPSVGLVFHLSVPRDPNAIFPTLRAKTTAGTIEDKPFFRATNPESPSLYMPDQRCLLLGQEAMVRKMVANRSHPVEGRMSKVLGRCDDSHDVLAILLVEPLRPMLNAELAKKGPLPPPLADVSKIPNLVDSLGIKANMTGSGGFTLCARCPDVAAATELERIVNGLLAMGKEKLTAEMSAKSAGANPQQAAMARQALQMSQKMFEMFQPVRKGDRLEVVQEGPGGIAAMGMSVALLLPAVQAAREAARRAQSMNNMKQIGLAILNHENANKSLPARAMLGKDGKPLLSWRVQMLPYLEANDLYRQFHLDEPWDSPNNKKLIDQMPAVFRNPSSNAPPNTTTYLAPVGPGTLFEGDKGRSMKEVRDGAANTIMLVEANDDQAVIWTKPDDWRYDPQKPLSGLGSAHPNLFVAMFCDGHIRSIAADIDPTVWKALLTFAGREVVDLP